RSSIRRLGETSQPIARRMNVSVQVRGVCVARRRRQRNCRRTIQMKISGKNLTGGFYVPDGNEALRDDIPVVVDLIERSARWVHPDTFRALPLWAPHTARGRPLYDARWSRRYTNTRKVTGVTAEKVEGNVA